MSEEYLKEHFDNMQEFLKNDNILITENDVDDEDFKALLFVSTLAFSYMIYTIPQALEYFKVIAQSDYPGMNLHLTPRTAELPENSLSVSIKTNTQNSTFDDNKPMVRYIRAIRDDQETLPLYKYVIKHINQSLVNRGFNIKEFDNQELLNK